jgi:hypothetical protein
MPMDIQKMQVLSVSAYDPKRLVSEVHIYSLPNHFTRGSLELALPLFRKLPTEEHLKQLMDEIGNLILDFSKRTGMLDDTGDYAPSEV